MTSTTEQPAHTLTAFDRLKVWLTRRLIASLERRISPAEGRVWWYNVTSFRPQVRMWLPGQDTEGWPEGRTAALLYIGVGGSEAEANRNRIIEVAMTREMLEQFRRNADHAVDIQDEQINAVKAVRGR
jgi:hypothetical protein